MWLALWLWSPAGAAETVEAMLAEAGAALAGGQYALASTLSARGLAQSAVDDLVRGRLLVIRGLSQQAQGQVESALIDFTSALQGRALGGEERARALFARGLSLDSVGRLKEAVGDYSAALAFAPGATYALNNRANVYRRQGQFELAKRDYAAALDANTPNPQYPYFGLGQIAEAEGDMQAARNLYARAVAADPGFQLALERLKAISLSPGALAVPLENNGIIVLKPPPPRRADTAVAQPQRTIRKPEKVSQTKAFAAAPVTMIQTGRPGSVAPALPPGRGAPLRPAITEGASNRSSAGANLVQLGAWRTEAEARSGWEVAQNTAGELLQGLTPAIVKATVSNRGSFFRLRVQPPNSAASFCAALESRGLACIPARD
jgi:tetratricopeptide (TPR) repeat protein